MMLARRPRPREGQSRPADPRPPFRRVPRLEDAVPVLVPARSPDVPRAARSVRDRERRPRHAARCEQSGMARGAGALDSERPRRRRARRRGLDRQAHSGAGGPRRRQQRRGGHARRPERVVAGWLRCRRPGAARYDARRRRAVFPGRRHGARPRSRRDAVPPSRRPLDGCARREALVRRLDGRCLRLVRGGAAAAERRRAGAGRALVPRTARGRRTISSGR